MYNTFIYNIKLIIAHENRRTIIFHLESNYDLKIKTIVEF